MTKEELAATLNGRQYREEITGDEEKAAHAAGLVVIFGASDDLMEMRGAVNDEVGAYGGGRAYFTSTGPLTNRCEADDCPYHTEEKKRATAVKALWNQDDYSWIYDTTIPHATFEIMEDDEKYCRGIVFALADVP